MLDRHASILRGPGHAFLNGMQEIENTVGSLEHAFMPEEQDATDTDRDTLKSVSLEGCSFEMSPNMDADKHRKRKVKCCVMM